MTATRLRYLLRLREVTNRTNIQVLSVYRDYGVIPKDSRSDNFNKTPEDITRYQEVRKGYLVVNKMKAWQGSVGISEYHGIVSPDYLVCSVDPSVHSRFMHYLLRSKRFAAEFGARSKGIRPAQWRLYWEDLAEIPVSLPPLDEQRRIADFLDAETSRIDRLADSQLRLLELLEERANSRILELIGQSSIVSPEGSAVISLQRVIAKLNRPVRPTDEVITAFRDGQVTARSKRRSEGYTMSANSEPQGQGVDAGDIVIHGLDGFAGAIGDSEASGNCTPVYHVCQSIDGGNSAFYGRLLRLLALGDYLTLFGASARERAVDFRNWKMFGHAPVPVVSPQEQHEIGEMITKIRPLREEVKRFNARLAERRQALITAAVTGEIDVTTAGRAGVA